MDCPRRVAVSILRRTCVESRKKKEVDEFNHRLSYKLIDTNVFGSLSFR